MYCRATYSFQEIYYTVENSTDMQSWCYWFYCYYVYDEYLQIEIKLNSNAMFSTDAIYLH